MVTLMSIEHADAVAGIHQRVLTDSVFTSIGRPFLEYYYRRLLRNERFVCHVRLVNGTVAGFISSTTASGAVFRRQMLQDGPAIAAVLARTVAGDLRRLAVISSAAWFLMTERRAMLPDIAGEILSFAVLPEYRATEVNASGAGVGPTPFYTQSGVSVAGELFAAAMTHLASQHVPMVKIMTGAENVASNRFYSKVGCRLHPHAFSVFGHRTNLYYGRVEELAARQPALSAAAA